jgi:hypothetical protein
VQIRANLPFRLSIPWARIIHTVDADEFDRTPARGVAGAARAMSNASYEAALRLGQQHRRDVLWHVEGSRAHLRFLEEANQLVLAKRRLQEAAGVWHMHATYGGE